VGLVYSDKGSRLARGRAHGREARESAGRFLGAAVEAFCSDGPEDLFDGAFLVMAETRSAGFAWFAWFISPGREKLSFRYRYVTVL
jgi:hypothetical protein